MSVVIESREFETQFDDRFSNLAGETARFRMIILNHAKACGDERHRLRDVLVQYLIYSPQADDLINELIVECIDLKTPERLDIAIDVLASLGCGIADYAIHFLQNDIKNYSHLYPDRAYKPNDDYWYILLRSVARADIAETRKLSFISLCSSASNRGVREGVVEALADVDTDASRAKLLEFTHCEDQFIAELAQEALDED